MLGMVRIIKSFLPEAGVLCYLLDIMKLWYINTLADTEKNVRHFIVSDIVNIIKKQSNAREAST